MYKYGVSHCCCGCSILNAENCGTEADFNRCFEHESGAVPSFSSSVQKATFSGNAKYFVKNHVVKEKLGLWLKPDCISSNDLRDCVTSVIYYIDIYIDNATRPTTWKVVYTAQYPVGYQPYKAEIYRNTTKMYETEALPCDGPQNDIVDSYRGLFDFKTWVIHNKDTGNVEFWGHVNASIGVPADYFFYSFAVSSTRKVKYKVHWEVIGTNWEIWPAFLEMWEPKEDEINCPTPSDCTYLIGNIKEKFPQLKIWFTGLGDIPNCKCSLLNNLDCYGVTKNRGYNTYTNWWTCCSLNFSQTRWITGQLETNPDYDSNKLDDGSATEKDVCLMKYGSVPVKLDLDKVYVGQSQQYEDRIDIVFSAYIDTQGSSYGGMITETMVDGVKFKGSVAKNSAGQIDLTRLNEVEFLPQLPSPGDYNYDPYSISIPIFGNAVGHIGLSNHTEVQAHNKAILGTQQSDGEIDYINLTCQIGFIGFTDMTRFPTGYEDFIQYYPTITTILSPRGQNWIDNPICNVADLNFVSPEISLGTRDTIKFIFWLTDGTLLIEKDLWNDVYLTVPGSAVISPRGAGNLNVTDTMSNCVPLASGTFYIQGSGQDGSGPGIPQTAGKFLNNIDKYGNSTIMCTYNYQGNGTQTWQVTMGQGYYGRAFIPDGSCSAPLDADGYPIYYYGGIPVMKGTIEIVYKQ